jgi:hypothetical protein
MPEVEVLAQPVELVGNCGTGGCLEFAWNLHRAVEDRRYQIGASIMATPETLLEWRAMHRTARKRADRCERLGYRFSKVDYSVHADALFEINTSKDERQGRPMSAGYRKFVERSRLPDYPCAAHRTITYGVLQGERLRAYMTLHRSGELALVSMILGHGDYLADDIMFLLFAGMVSDQAGCGGILYYNRHDSGQEGLRFFKERLGFSEGNVEWVL